MIDGALYISNHDEHEHQYYDMKTTLYYSELTIILNNMNPRNGNERVIKKQCNITKAEMLKKIEIESYVKPTTDCKKYGENWVFIDENGKLQASNYAKKFDKEEFKKVDCYVKNVSKAHLFMDIIPQDEAIKNAEEIERPSFWSGLSVYWLSFDSISQMKFRRSFPKTMEYLEKNLEAITLNGYNGIGDEILPILTGKTEFELSLTQKNHSFENNVDDYPFIWKNFSNYGYITAYVSTNYKNFQNQPTNHFAQISYHQSKKVFKTDQCFDFNDSVDVWLKYSKEFLTKYPKETPKFGFFHHSFSINDSLNSLRNLDESVKQHFMDLYKGGYFDNTAVFFGSIQEHQISALSKIGQGDDRLRMMSIILPEKFTGYEMGQTVYKNLKTNAYRLTTPFDIYSTFLDIINLPDDLISIQSLNDRSLSLFRPIPETRTCQDANIGPEQCICFNWRNTTYSLSKKLANGIIDAINEYTNHDRKLCAPLSLDKLIQYLINVPDENVIKNKDDSATYSLTFSTKPGNGKYQAIVQYDTKSNVLTVDMLAISHLNNNNNNNTLHCISENNLHLFSYCVC
uniref:Uncharacterized protein n=1 Tax=Panagrolaimus sp. PS1159 TaxID=55785 RepID=A0AC35F9Q2_9BILA